MREINNGEEIRTRVISFVDRRSAGRQAVDLINFGIKFFVQRVKIATFFANELIARRRDISRGLNYLSRSRRLSPERRRNFQLRT